MSTDFANPDRLIVGVLRFKTIARDVDRILIWDEDRSFMREWVILLNSKRDVRLGPDYVQEGVVVHGEICFFHILVYERLRRNRSLLPRDTLDGIISSVPNLV